jgi:hypothetical protein
MIITPRAENPKATGISLTNTVTANPRQTMVVTQNRVTQAIGIATAADQDSRYVTKKFLIFHSNITEF